VVGIERWREREEHLTALTNRGSQTESVHLTIRRGELDQFVAGIDELVEGAGRDVDGGVGADGVLPVAHEGAGRGGRRTATPRQRAEG